MKHAIFILLIFIGFSNFSNAQEQHNFVPLDNTAFVIGTLDSPRLKVGEASPYHGYITAFSCSQQYLRPYVMEALEGINGLSTDSIQVVEKYASAQFLISEKYADYLNAYFTFQSFSKLNGQFKEHQLEKGHANVAKFTTELQKKSFLTGYAISKGKRLSKDVFSITLDDNLPFLQQVLQLVKSIGYKAEMGAKGHIIFTVTDTAYSEYITKALKEKTQFEKNCQ